LTTCAGQQLVLTADGEQGAVLHRVRERLFLAAPDRRHETLGEHFQRAARTQAMLGQRFIEALQIGGNGGEKRNSVRLRKNMSIRMMIARRRTAVPSTRRSREDGRRMDDAMDQRLTVATAAATVRGCRD
jgi:hypothetical protein